jgi:glycosyltransferase involved in cell wall biosynthesis
MNLNIISPINQLGYGIASLNIVKSLAELEHDVGLFVIGQAEAAAEHAELLQSCVNNAAVPDFNAPSVRIWHQHDMSQFVGRGMHVGFPIFELDTFTKHEMHHLNYLDKILVCSQWAKDIVVTNLYNEYKDDNVALNTHVVPLGVDRNIFREAPSSRAETVFFNCGKWEVRKGHDILAKAFNEAFKEEDNVELWMMCDNPFNSREENGKWESMCKGSGLGNKIRMIPRQKTQDDVYNIMIQTDCGVFPARAEGWNLELLEMMSCGKQVIATNYSAHTEFCDHNNCLLIDTDNVEPAQDGKWFFGQGNWAKIEEKQFNSLVEHMRMIHDLKQSGKLYSNSSGIETAIKYSWENTAKEIVNALST